MNKEMTTRDDMIRAALRDDWEFVDANIREHISFKDVCWAIGKGLASTDYNVRDLAATILDETDTTIGQNIRPALETQMKDDPHRIVRLRLAIALWKNNHRSDAVKAMMKDALEDPDVGAVAKKWQN